MMDHRRILQATARAVGLFAPLFLVPIPFAFVFGDPTLGSTAIPASALAFAASSLLAVLVWLPATLAYRDAAPVLLDREAYLTVAASSLVISLLAMVPFLLTGAIESPVSAWMEAMAGLTTTSTSVLESDLASIMVWRATLSFAGGFAFLVLGVAVLSRLTRGARLRGESLSQLRPRFRTTAKAITKPYVIAATTLFVLLFAALTQQGHGLGDGALKALILAMSTISTGGFGGSEMTAFIQVLLMAFMVIAATNFVSLAEHDWKLHRVFLTHEGRSYLATLVLASVLAVVLVGPSNALEGVFLVVTSLTGTGFDTITPDGLLSLLVLALVMAGGMVGSTAGGIKFMRLVLMVKIVRREVRRLLHPRAIIPIRLDGRVLREESVLGVVAFVFAFATTWLIGATLLSSFEPDVTAFEGAIVAGSALASHGGHFGALDGGYESLSGGARFLLGGLMWLGRLEIFTALVLFSPTSWRN